MTTKILMMPVLAAVLCGCHQAKKQISYEDLVQHCVTNDVPGYARTINIDVNYTPTNLDDLATADATVEFLDQAGDTVQTNLPYRIFVSNNRTNPAQNKTMAQIDSAVIAQRQADEYWKEMNAISNPKQ